MNILITSAGRRVSLVRSFQNELKKFDPKGMVYTSDSNPLLSAACQVADMNFRIPKLNESDYIDILIEMCRIHDICLIIPTIDTELLELARNKARFSERGIAVVVSSVEFVSKCRDKRLIHKFFEEHNINVAKEYSKDNYRLPVFVKPFDGSSVGFPILGHLKIR